MELSKQTTILFTIADYQNSPHGGDAASEIWCARPARSIMWW